MSLNHANITPPSTAGEALQSSPAIGDILDRGGIFVGHQTTSKKRLLEQIANIFAEQLAGTNTGAGQIFSTLIERENLGSTGIGNGIALPHGRIPGLDYVAGIFLRLQDPLDFDAVDHLPVNLIFAILVPENATEEHLKLLASLAAIFRDESLRQKLLETTDTAQIRAIFNTSPGDGGQH